MPRRFVAVILSSTKIFWNEPLELALISPLGDIAANNGFEVVATACPIATSSAFTVTPVPAPTAKDLSDANVPPPVKPSPAVKVLPCKVSTLPSSVVTLVEKLALGAVKEPLMSVAICAELDTMLVPVKGNLICFAFKSAISLLL